MLSLTLYNIFTADIVKCIPESVNIGLYADDMAIYSSAEHLSEILQNLQYTIHKIQNYCNNWSIKINPTKTQAIFLTRKYAPRNLPNNNDLKINNTAILWQNSVKYLGLTLDKRLTYKNHFVTNNLACEKIIKMLYSLLNSKSKLTPENKKLIYLMVIRSKLLYGSPIWANCAKIYKKKLQVIQNRCLKLIYGLPKRFSTIELHQKANLPTIETFMNHINLKFRLKLSSIPNPIVQNLN